MKQKALLTMAVALTILGGTTFAIADDVILYECSAWEDGKCVKWDPAVPEPPPPTCVPVPEIPCPG